MINTQSSGNQWSSPQTQRFGPMPRDAGTPTLERLVREREVAREVSTPLLRRPPIRQSASTSRLPSRSLGTSYGGERSACTSSIGRYGSTASFASSPISRPLSPITGPWPSYSPRLHTPRSYSPVAHTGIAPPWQLIQPSAVRDQSKFNDVQHMFEEQQCRTPAADGQPRDMPPNIIGTYERAAKLLPEGSKQRGLVETQMHILSSRLEEKGRQKQRAMHASMSEMWLSTIGAFGSKGQLGCVTNPAKYSAFVVSAKPTKRILALA